MCRYCLSDLAPFCFRFVGEVEDELLHTYTKVYTFDALLVSVRLAVLMAVTLTVPLVLFPVSKAAADAEIGTSPYTLTVCTQHRQTLTLRKSKPEFLFGRVCFLICCLPRARTLGS